MYDKELALENNKKERRFRKGILENAGLRCSAIIRFS